MTSNDSPLMSPTWSSERWPLAGGVLLAGAFSLFSLTYAPLGGASGAALVAGMTLGLALGVAWSARHRRTSSACGDDTLHMLASTTLAGVLEHCENAIVLTDPSLRAWYANEAFSALSGRSMCSAAGTTIVDALAHRIADGETFARSLHELTLHVEQEAAGEITRLGIPARTFEWRSVPLRGSDGSVSGRGFLFHDRSQARELAGLKGDFLSTVAHELRTPLTSVKGSLQLVLGKSTALSPIDCELLNISLKNADRLIRLINDLLDISRLELGKIEFTFTKVPTASLVEEAVAGLRAYAGAREITIGCEIVADVPALEGDRDRLIQVLTNLISNAVKFSPARSHVLVRAARLGEEVAITVRDWGIGIRTADQSRLFQRFLRLEPGHSDEPGTGLGLAISKAIVDRHGGRITVTSGENAGSTFTIMVPAVKETPVPSSDRRKRDASAGGPPTILLIDDDQDLGATLERAWHDRYRLLRVERGIEALDTARQARPDLVLLDVVLPDLSGYDVLRILRTTVATSAIPVIMLAVQPERALATNLGAVDVVGKPLDLDRLTYAVEHALQERHTDTGLCIAVGPCNARREELIAALRSHGHRVLEAHDALDLLRCADDHVPDVAVVGLDPTSDGPERTLTLLRNHPSTRSLPVVLLSERQTGAPAVNGCTWMEPGANDEAVLRAVERAGRRRVVAA